MRLIVIFLMLIPLYTFAEDCEIIGQFVIAPFSAGKCQASTTTLPTSGLSIQSELFCMLTYTWDSNDIETSIQEMPLTNASCDDVIAIYSLDGQKQNELKHGFNILVDLDGQTRKIIVK